MNKIDIKSLSKEELVQALADMGGKGYRASQIFRWLYKTPVRSFADMTDLPADLRKKLAGVFHITHPALLDEKRSSADGTTKYLLKLEDSNTIEAVFLPERSRNTICLSSQVGCKYGCNFCASAPFGFVRNLKPSEIIDQVLFIKGKNPERVITNLVLMGIGEPLDNYDNVLKAIRILNNPDGSGIGARRITISTCGIIPGIERLKKEGIQVELAVSLHSADDKIRSKLVPINKKYPLKDLIKACKDYIDTTGRMITFEYVLMKDVNSSKEDALVIAKLLKNINCKVNTISYNQISPVRNSAISNGVSPQGHNPPSGSEVKLFMKTLKDNGINAVNRKSKGEDVDAGCGQLRISRL